MTNNINTGIPLTSASCLSCINEYDCGDCGRCFACNVGGCQVCYYYFPLPEGHDHSLCARHLAEAEEYAREVESMTRFIIDCPVGTGGWHSNAYYDGDSAVCEFCGARPQAREAWNGRNGDSAYADYQAMCCGDAATGHQNGLC